MRALNGGIMKNNIYLIITSVFLFSAFYMSEPGVKNAEFKVTVTKNIPSKGLEILKAKTKNRFRIDWNESYTIPSSIMGELTSAGYVKNNFKTEGALRFLSENKELFGIQNPSEELKLISSTDDEFGQTHIKFQQKFGNVILFKGQLIVHISKDGKIVGVNGRYYPTLNFNTEPKINVGDAISSAKNFLGNYNATRTSTELILLERGVKFYLCYAVKMSSKFTPNMVVYVDAESGSVIYKDDGIRYDGPVTGSGLDLKNQVRQINTYLYGNTYYLINTALPMFVPPFDSLKGVIDVYDAQNDTSGNGYQSAILVSDPNNDNNFNDNERLKAAVSAHLFVLDAYNFYKNRFNRNSYDNAGHSMINVVHYKQNYNNAFWNGAAMSYGDGDNVYMSNLAGGYDVIVHELTHAVTERTANLVYENQPGALNESMSDCMASAADTLNWDIGEDIYTPNTPNDALRNMLFPHNNSAPNSNDWQPEHMNEFVNLPNTPEGDYGGVHINSGIPNRAFALTAESITRKKASLIWYRALTNYLTNNSNFSDARTACVNSAIDIYGSNSTEMNAVVTAFETVGITGSTSGQLYDLTYDDGNPTGGVYEADANWELAVKFTPPSGTVNITKCAVYIAGEDNINGNGGFTLKMYDSFNGFPNNNLINPYSYIPSEIGWQVFTISNLSVNGEFFVSIQYDGFNRPYIGAANPPGNQRAYESNGSSWWKLTSPYDYTLYMRATVQTLTGDIEISTEVPSNFEILQNYPNPFNPTTKIAYSLPKSENVSLIVYDISGKVIAKLIDNFQNAGTYSVTWNGKNTNGENVSSGVYFYEIKAGEFKATKKMLLLK